MFTLKTPYIWYKKGSALNEQPEMVYFRKEFSLEKVPEQCIVQVSADSRYRLLVNGTDVCCGPCKGDNHVWYYEEIDIAANLKPGLNVIAAKVLRYPLVPDKGNLSVFSMETPHFYCKEASEKEQIGIHSDESWRCLRINAVQILPEYYEVNHAGTINYLWVNERVDGAKVPHGWELPGFDANEWEPAVPAIEGMYAAIWLANRTFRKRPIPLMPEIKKRFASVSAGLKSWEELITSDRPITLEPNSVHVVDIDAGELETGYYELSFAKGAGTAIEILCSEGYSQRKEDGTFCRRDREDADSGELQGYTDYYRVGGNGTAGIPETWSPFWFRTFRYIRLSIQTREDPCIVTRCSYRETGYPLEVTTAVKSSSNELNRIYDMCLRTLKRCMHETYEDCPFYEQFQYAMDTRTQILFTYVTANDDRMARRTIDDFHRSLRPDGFINSRHPSRRDNVIPGFSFFYIFMIHDHMMYYGDKNLVASYFNTVERILYTFTSRICGENSPYNGMIDRIGGILTRGPYWSFIDWCDEWTIGVPNAINDGPLTMENMLCLLALQKTAEMADFIDRSDLGSFYRKRAAALADVIKKHCYSVSKGLFTDGPGYEKDFSEHPQVFAVLTGIVEKSEAAALLERMFNTKGLAKCSVAMAFYTFRALEAAGLYDKYFDVLWEPWREMLANHMTTCQESPGENARSDCHAWGAVALYELPAGILGVRPLEPGYATALIHPHLAGLDSAEGTVETPRGPITVRLQKNREPEIDARGFMGAIKEI